MGKVGNAGQRGPDPSYPPDLLDKGLNCLLETPSFHHSLSRAVKLPTSGAQLNVRGIRVEGSSGVEPPGWTREVKPKERREKATGGSVCATLASCWMMSCSTGDAGFVRSQQRVRPWLCKVPFLPRAITP